MKVRRLNNFGSFIAITYDKFLVGTSRQINNRYNSSEK